MKTLTFSLRVLSAGLLLCPLLTAAAIADRGHDRTQVASNIAVGPNEGVSEATCFGCSVRVRGHVAGDVTTFAGSVMIEDQGQVDGDVTTFGGDIRLDKEVSVKGDVTVFGGRLRRDPAARVGGDVTNMGGPGWIVLILAFPVLLLGLFVAFLVWLVRRLLRPAPPASS